VNEVLGLVNSWNFRQYVFAASFYYLISENFTSYIESINFVKLNQEIKTTVTEISKFRSDIDANITEVEGA